MNIMRCYLNLLRESMKEIQGVPVWIDPSAVQLLALAKKTTLRGSIIAGQMYVWDAADDTHYGMYSDIVGYEEDYSGNNDFMIGNADDKEMEDWESGIEVSPGIVLSGNEGALSHPVIQSLLSASRRGK